MGKRSVCVVSKKIVEQIANWVRAHLQIDNVSCWRLVWFSWSGGGGGGGREGNYNFLFNTRNLFRVSRNPSGLITFRRQKKVVNARSKSMIISSLALHQKPTLHDHYYGNTGVIYLSNMHATPIDTCCTVFRPVFCWFWQPQNANSINHEILHRWRSRSAGVLLILFE